MTIVFDTINRVIEIESPATEVTIQSLINAVRDFEDSPEGMIMASIANAAGKQDLGGGIAVGITLELINDWRIQFEARGTQTFCFIRGGNLVASNQYGNNPIKASDNVNVILELSTSASISEGSGSPWSDQEKDIVMSNLDFIKAVEGGRWKIDNEQMIFYEPDNETEIARFRLLGKDGKSTDQGVYERRRV